MKRKILFIIATLLILVAVPILFIYFGFRSEDNKYTDFTRFKSVEEVQAYLSPQFTVNRTNLEAVRAFIEQQELRRCDYFEISGTEYMHCRVRAPEDNMDLLNRVFVQFFYDIYFFFENDILITSGASLSFALILVTGKLDKTYPEL